MPITLDESFVDLLRTEAILVEPTVEMADEPDLDSAVNARKGVGYKPIGKQIDVSGQRTLP